MFCARTLRSAALRTSRRIASFSTQTSVFTWGTGTQGQLGHGPFAKSGMRNSYEELTPRLVDALEGKSIIKMDFGASHSAALDDAGRVYIWGSNEYNKLGLGKHTKEIEPLPRRMDAFNGVEIVDISCGSYHTAAVDKDGKMYSWGWGGSTLKGVGGLGHEGGHDEPTPRLLTTLVDQGVPMAKVECGEFHTIGLTKDQEVWAWGNGEYGRLGNGETNNLEVPEPVEYFAKDNIKQIAAGKDFTFVLTENGELYTWGGNNYNQLGIGGGLTIDMYSMETIPVMLEAFSGIKVKQVAAGYEHAAAVTEEGKLYTWGNKLWVEPHEMTILKDFNIVSVACGRRFTAALSDTGRLFTFGKGNSNSLGHGERTTLLQPAPVMALAEYNVASVTCGESHMGIITKPHSTAADKDFSLRE